MNNDDAQIQLLFYQVIQPHTAMLRCSCVVFYHSSQVADWPSTAECMSTTHASDVFRSEYLADMERTVLIQQWQRQRE